MSNLKVYEEITTVTLKDWTKIHTPINVDKLLQACNSWTTFIKLDWVMINTSMIAHAQTNQTTALEQFIYRQKKEVQEDLNKLIEQRKKEWFRNSIEILKQYYKNNYWVDLV